MIKLSKIRLICRMTEHEFDNYDPSYNLKKHRMDQYEKLAEIQVLDSAFPADWADAVREKFHVKNIGNWAWAYGTDGMHLGVPVPCDQRSLAYFESMLGDPHGALLIKKHYETEEGDLYHESKRIRADK